MLDLFGVPWTELRRSHVEGFLDEAGEEGVTWEAKGGGEDQARPRSDSLRKAACGFANQIGGYLIIGASRKDGKWRLEGIEAPSEEPKLWIGQILRRLQPVPRFEISEAFELAEGKVAIVVKVEPVAVPPCMTPDGRVFERVSGETLPVEDPVLLDGLLRRGEHARGRAENFARRAAERAIALPDWPTQHSLSIAVGLASVGRETDDISSRLFTEPTYNAIVKSIWELLDGIQPEGLHIGQQQDAYTAIGDSPANNHYDVDETIVGVIRTSRFLQANWDGSVAAGAWFSDDPLQDAIHPEQLIANFWGQAAAIGQLLGGYGPAYLYVLIRVAKSGAVEVHGQVARIAGRPPPKGTLYAKLPALTEMGRLLNSAEPSEEIVNSLRRELQRAGGIRTDEPA
ncbi:MAG TPA: ATP-binding protein [Solirubrobacterales bacterium]|nr:ATP-binding protein [Solirubrobacterales bacterium]